MPVTTLTAAERQFLVPFLMGRKVYDVCAFYFLHYEDTCAKLVELLNARRSLHVLWKDEVKLLSEHCLDEGVSYNQVACRYRQFKGYGTLHEKKVHSLESCIATKAHHLRMKDRGCVQLRSGVLRSISTEVGVAYSTVRGIRSRNMGLQAGELLAKVQEHRRHQTYRLDGSTNNEQH